MPIEAIVFDMDGLLFDTERLYIDLYKKIEPRYGLHLPEQAYIDCIGTTREKTAEIIIANADDTNFDYDAFKAEIDGAFEAYRNTVGLPVKTGVREILSKIRTIGLPMGVASSSPRRIVCSNLEHAGLLTYFSCIVGGDEISRGKPAPEIYLTAATILGKAPENILAFEDSALGIRAAVSAGIRVIAVPDILDFGEKDLFGVFRVCSDLLEAADLLPVLTG